MDSLNISVNTSSWRSNITGHGFDNPFKKTHVRVLFVIVYAVVFAMCILGNSMVLFAIARSPRLRSVTNFFLANLAVADFCVGAFCILPNLSTFIQPNWILGKAMCKIYYYIWNVSYTASIIIMTVIAIERYIAIIHPLKARHIMTNTKQKVVQIVIWLTAFIYNIPFLFFYDIFSFGTDKYCYSDFDNIYSLKGLSLVNILFWYMIPLLLIGVLYYRVAKALWKTTVVAALRLHQYPEADSGSNGSCNSTRCPHYGGGEQTRTQCRQSTSYITRQHNFCKSDSDPSHSSDNVLLYKGMHALTIVCGDANKHEVVMPTEIKCCFQSTSDYYDDNESHARLCYIREHSSDPIHNGHAGQNSPTSHNGKAGQTPRRTTKPSYRYRETDISSSRRVTRARRKVIKLLLAVVITFGICVLPHMVKVLNHYWHIFTLPHSIDAILSPVSFVVLYLNSALNPILYALFSNTFRRSFKESLHCLRKRK